MKDENIKEKEYYREKIIEIVKKADNTAKLKFISSIVEDYLKNRG